MEPVPIVPPPAVPPGVVVPPPVVPPGVGAAAVPAVFALHPAALMHNAAFLDYSSTEGRKAYERAIEPLDPVYDGTQKGLQMFIHKVKRKAGICGWLDSILTIPTHRPTPLSLLTNYGQITLRDIYAHADTYLGQNVRANQDASNLKVFLDGSLDTDIMMRVLAQNDKYTINGIEHGPSMFRVIIGIIGIETRATVAVINESLRNLPSKLIELKYNITLFNEYVTGQCLELTSRGKQPSDLLDLLFRAYLTAKNRIFVDYIRGKESSTYDNSIIEMEPEELMLIAEDRYKIMVLRSEWKETKSVAESTTDEHIIALRAAVEALTDKSKKSNQTSTANGANRTTTRPPNQNTGKWAWKDIEPKANDPTWKVFQGKEYVHCPHHATTKWVLYAKHKDGCTADPSWRCPVKPSSAASVNESNTNDEDPKKLQYIKALMSVVTPKHDDDDETEENI
jgi:hypothetical protein